QKTSIWLINRHDFNYNIEERAETIRNEIISGSYKVSQPLIYRIEKKYGICRHLVNPQPSDALVFQVLVENINEQILKKQPSKNAFYSRDKHSVAKPHSIEDSYFNWHEQWKRLQKKIYNFNEEKEYIVVTDLTNYYDSIDLNELRKVLTSYTGIKEVVIDLIFKIIEDISWKPDYLPYSRRGLPTTNIEGVRLLAHSFLFEIDEVLKQKTNNSFTRWMDDITIGVDSKKQAIETISEISDMLKSRGLALNLSKTNIYNARPVD
ncbi:Reverse transcriptase (RNA-dependent DNA polymerase), partial [Paenibacillus tianmuensis]